VLLDDLAVRFPGLAHSLGDVCERQPPHVAFLLPLHATRDRHAVGMLAIAVSACQRLDDVYLSFVDLVAQQTCAGIAEAKARQLERERMERLAELDRAKTEFFSNVSHEFRTPLTMMLAPLEEMRRAPGLAPALCSALDVAARNGKRLIRLVNDLLDFSSIESQRWNPPLQPTDLASLTSDLVSLFRSAIEEAGLTLRLEMADNLPPVPLNRDMWEKIVSNLLSNALKFTFEGEIVVRLHSLRLHAELEISDTGVGIPREELPNVFQRFHRVRGTRARTADGSGIGLSIVHDLVHRMGGQISVRSLIDRGTTFTIWLPLTSRRQAGTEPARAPAADVRLASDLASEASRWLLDASKLVPPDVLEDLVGPPSAEDAALSRESKSRLLVVDDNADVRDYLVRLLGRFCQVDLAASGEEGLAQARRSPPDVVVADVMMPGMDGFQLLRALRAEAQLEHMPVILLSARAGEASAVEGLRAGAVDYIAKPFSPRELVARVHGAVTRARAEAALRKREAYLSAQSQALEAALDDVPLEESLGLLCGAAVEQFGPGTRTAFYLADTGCTSLRHVVGMGSDYAAMIDGFVIGADSLACGLAAFTGRPILTADVDQEPRWKTWRWIAKTFDYRGVWSFPVHTSVGHYVGSFAVYSRTPRAATTSDIEFAGHVTRAAAIIISRHFLTLGGMPPTPAILAPESGLQRVKT
jgi:signal transduction histidine kinase/FixJ family two-component response regulator